MQKLHSTAHGFRTESRQDLLRPRLFNDFASAITSGRKLHLFESGGDPPMKGIWMSLAAAALMVFTPALQAEEVGQPGNGRNARSGGACPNCPTSRVPLHDGKGPHGRGAAKQGHGMGKAGRAQRGNVQGRRGLGPRDGTGMSNRGWDSKQNGRPGWGSGGGRGRTR
jgi:hypothetical protein